MELGILVLVLVIGTARAQETTMEPDLETTTPLPSFNQEEAAPKPIHSNITSVAENEIESLTPSGAREAKIAWLWEGIKDYKPSPDLDLNYPYYLSGFDYEDRPIWVAELGKYDLKKIVEAGPESMATFDKYTRLAAYRMMSSHTLRNPTGHNIVFILDFEGLKIAQLASLPTMTYLLTLARDYRKLIEDYTHYVIVINANYVTEALANLVRPVFGRILEIADIHGPNKARWLPELLKRFPKDQIPEWYGGNKGYKPIAIYG